MKMKKTILLMPAAILAIAAGGLLGKSVMVGATGAYSGGTGTAEDPFLISTAADWSELAAVVASEDENAPQAGIYFKLTDDIQVTAGIGANSTAKTFAGTFDGDGHAVSLTGTGMGSVGNGLFGTNVGVIKNLTRNGRNSGNSNQGGIAGNNGGTVENCINNAEIAISGRFSGGIVGVNAWNNNPGKIINCVNNGHVYTLGSAGGSTMTNPTFQESYGNCIAGIAGWCYDTAGSEITGCVNNGLIEGFSGVGGIVGWTKNTTSFTISGCTNTGTIRPYDAGDYAFSGLTTAQKSYVGHFGGIVGMLGSGHKVSGCVNTGDVISYGGRNSGAWRGTGGIVGSFYTKSSIENCISFGDIEGNVHVGGILGYAQNAGEDSAGTITGCFAAGTIKAYTENAGGIHGRGNTANISNCKSAATIDCATASGKVRGGGNGTLTNNTEYTISDNAATILRYTQAFVCDDVKTATQKTVMYGILDAALNDLTGTDDMTVLNMTLKSSTYYNTAVYIRDFCAAGLQESIFNVFSAERASWTVPTAIAVVGFVVCSALLIGRRKKNSAR